ncbi:hypothetical protein F4821DRAFT_63438 [Hypoxylon rubiginosum]|uniref:Uncharacterized protein n=1 Tax=Hypoxylon rubiginosum TaxID=110542 RepID=A0ACC0D9G8_9PEZI|nr:hypothetical protein F4821DRAFT_63438 [Hypoxylon rubiginosum]
MLTNMDSAHTSAAGLADTTKNDSVPRSHQLPVGNSQVELSDENAISLDTRKLQTQHTTEGYRDGITNGKADSLQAGFDEGFGLGATIGLNAGRLLGLLEGLVDSFNETGVDSPAQLDKLLSEARKELNEASIFAEEYWGHDGTWKYPVEEPEIKDERLTENVARRHPAIAKWAEKLDNDVKF